MHRVPVSAIRQALERLDHAQRSINGGLPQHIHPRLRGHSSDFIFGAAWALQWVLDAGGDVDAGPCGKLSKDIEDPRYKNDRFPDGSLPLR